MSHAAGVGPATPARGRPGDAPAAREHARARAQRLPAAARRPAPASCSTHGIHPVVPEQGSVGASGDLAPLAHLALPLIGRGPGRVLIVGVAAPVLATLVALPVNRTGLGSAISIYLLAVVTASLLGGLRGGLVAAVLSSLAFTFFFTEPRYTLRIEHGEDVAAALGLLVAAVLVGLVLSSALDERRRAERSEREARLLAYLSTRLLSGEPLPRVLDDFVGALLDPFHLLRCDLVAVAGDREVRASAVAAPGGPDGPSEVVPLELGGSAFGELTAVRRLGAPAMSGDERALLDAFARQAAVALERDRLASRMREAQLDAETNQLRAALFSSVTHDLRTPLASIKAGVTSLLDTGATHDAGQQHELLTTVLEETDRLEPAGRQHHGPRAHPGGRAGAVAGRASRWTRWRPRSSRGCGRGSTRRT